MDSQHRHELEQNDLESFLRNAGQFWKKYGTQVLSVILIVVLIITGYTMWQNNRQANFNNNWNAVADNQTAEGYEMAARNADLPAAKALGFLRAGDIFLQESRQQTLDGETVTPEVRTRLLEKAAENYDQVINNAKFAELMRLNARLGRAAVAVAMDDWENAQQQYEFILENGKEYEAVFAQAKGQLEWLPRLQTPVTFAPDPVELGNGEAGGSQTSPLDFQIGQPRLNENEADGEGNQPDPLFNDSTTPDTAPGNTPGSIPGTTPDNGSGSTPRNPSEASPENTSEEFPASAPADQSQP